MKATVKLLTSDLKTQIEAKIKECYKKASEHFERDFEFPEIRYDLKSWTAGIAYSKFNRIRFNLILLNENEKDFIHNTVPHEAAHLITRNAFVVPDGRKRIQSHGKEWKSVMRLLNLEPIVKHSYDCSSIEKWRGRNPKEQEIDLTRAERLILRLQKWTDEEREQIRNAL